MATPKWFDANAYMQNKLAQLKAQEPDAGWTLDKLYDAFREGGFVGAEGQYEHFVKFGAAEEVAPNAYFNADEYYAAKAHEYYGDKFDGSEEQIATVKAMIKDAGMNAWTHYQQFGSAEGVNPSNAFDASAYCAAKAEAMNNAGQKAPDGTEWTAEKVADAIADAGMSVLEHYLTYAGTGEGEVALDTTYPVADDNQVVVPNLGVKIAVDNDGSSYNGTAGDDSFYVKVDNTLQAYHTLDGGEGNDTLFLGDQEQVGTIKNIENLVARGGNGNEYDLSAFSTSFTLEKADGNVTVDNVTDQKLVVSSTSAASTLTVNMAAGQASVDLTSQNRDNAQTFKLKGDSLTSVKLAVDEGARGVVLNGSNAKVTDLAVTAADSNDAAQVKANVIVQNMTNLANVTVAGAGAVALNDVRGDKLKAVNAAENTGGVTVDLREADNAAFTGGAGADKIMVDGSKVAHTLGAGDDTVVVKVKDDDFANLEKGFSVDGGEGVDTLEMIYDAAATMTSDAFKVFTNFEKLTIEGAVSGELDMADYTGIGHLTLKDGLIGVGTITNMQSGSTLELTQDAGIAFTVGVKGATEGTADELNIALTADGAGIVGNTITVADVETINVVATDPNLSNGVAEHSLDLKAAAATSVTVSGDAKLELTLNAGSVKIKDINASENTGGLVVDVNVGELSGVTVTGSSATDVIKLGELTVATGGEGKDTFVVRHTDMTKYATITDFGAGDTITMGAAAGNTLGEAISLQGTAQFADYVNEAVQGANATNKVSWFTFGENTYLVLDGTDGDVFAAGDIVVQLQGVFNLKGMDFDGGSMTLTEGA